MASGLSDGRRSHWREDFRKWSEDRMRSELERHDNSIQALGRSLNCERGVLYRQVKELGIEFHRETIAERLAKVDPERLRRLWNEHDHNCTELAKRLGFGRHHVSKLLYKHGITPQSGRRKFPWSREFLHKMYVVEGKTLREIGEFIGTCPANVLYQMGRYKIPTRPQEFPQSRKGTLTERMPREVLFDLYVTKQVPTKDIAKQFGCSQQYVRHRMTMLGIPMRHVGGVPKKRLDCSANRAILVPSPSAGG